MPSPFPEMDPYLEHPSAWHNVHHRLITAIAMNGQATTGFASGALGIRSSAVFKRWQVEVTFEEVRAHLGVETQWQWSDLAPYFRVDE